MSPPCSCRTSLCSPSVPVSATLLPAGLPTYTRPQLPVDLNSGYPDNYTPKPQGERSPVDTIVQAANGAGVEWRHFDVCTYRNNLNKMLLMTINSKCVCVDMSVSCTYRQGKAMKAAGVCVCVCWCTHTCIQHQHQHQLRAPRVEPNLRSQCATSDRQGGSVCVFRHASASAAPRPTPLCLCVVCPSHPCRTTPATNQQGQLGHGCVLPPGLRHTVPGHCARRAGNLQGRRQVHLLWLSL